MKKKRPRNMTITKGKISLVKVVNQPCIKLIGRLKDKVVKSFAVSS